MKKLPKDCFRTGPNTLMVGGVSVSNRIYANEEVPIEADAVIELAKLLEVQDTADQMYAACPEMFKVAPKVHRVSLSPDFHKGAGIPIGTSLMTEGMVIPQSVGSDINCGVKLLGTNLTRKDIKGKLDKLEPLLRSIYFEGGRSIPLSQKQRRCIVTQGIAGLEKETDDGIWKYFDPSQHAHDIQLTRHLGGFDTQGQAIGLEEYIGKEGTTRDSQIGSIGGGNHFVELQYVDKIIERTTAYGYGLQKNQLVLMVHSGSISIGHMCGGLYQDLTKKIYKRTGLKFPKNKIFPLPNNVPEYRQFWSMLHNAANFAFANRLFLGLMFKQALSEVFGEGAVEMKQVYDTPHNLAWEDAAGTVLHRKGTSPAESRDVWHLGLDKATQERMAVTCGEPVLIPGSMGSASFVMEGCGNIDALKSASHGAGRSLSRGKALKHDEAAFQEFLTKFRIITPIDPNRRDIKGRKDILQQWHDSLKKEAPFAYKDVYPVVNTLKDAKIATPVAELQPILTLKGS
jgi:tRNA-splicing ligase RtcB